MAKVLPSSFCVRNRDPQFSFVNFCWVFFRGIQFSYLVSPNMAIEKLGVIVTKDFESLVLNLRNLVNLSQESSETSKVTYLYKIEEQQFI